MPFGSLAQLFSDPDDLEEAEYNEFICSSLADADEMRTIQCRTGENLRDFWTVEDCDGLVEEANDKRHFNWRKS